MDTPNSVSGTIMKTLLLTTALLALPAFAHADELPDEMVGRWCHVDTQWDSAAFGLFVQKDCKDGTGFDLTSKTTRVFFSGSISGAVYPNSRCTIDRVTKLEDEHYLVEDTCVEDGGPDDMHPGRGQPYSGSEILFLDTCGRLQSKTPEYCHPHCLDEPGSTFQSEPSPGACRLSELAPEIRLRKPEEWGEHTIFDAPNWLVTPYKTRPRMRRR
jgi:hypothetical protein